LAIQKPFEKLESEGGLDMIDGTFSLDERERVWRLLFDGDMTFLIGTVESVVGVDSEKCLAGRTFCRWMGLKDCYDELASLSDMAFGEPAFFSTW
jgi:hypothetical protein